MKLASGRVSGDRIVVGFAMAGKMVVDGVAGCYANLMGWFFCRAQSLIPAPLKHVQVALTSRSTS